MSALISPDERLVSKAGGGNEDFSVLSEPDVVQNKRSSSGILHTCFTPREQQQRGSVQPQPQNSQAEGANTQPGACGRHPHACSQSLLLTPHKLEQRPSPTSLQPASSRVGMQSQQAGQSAHFGHPSLNDAGQQGAGQQHTHPRACCGPAFPFPNGRLGLRKHWQGFQLLPA